MLTVATVSQAFEPWDPLVSDSWIFFGEPQTRIVTHSVNEGDYEIGFDQSRKDGSARGGNALKFSYGDNNTGHLIAESLAGSFDVENTGDNRVFSDLIFLVAINAVSLPVDFSMSMAVSGGSTYNFDLETDFTYYDHGEYDTGRPSGYYSVTSPSSEGISYSFSAGVVTVFAAAGVNLGPSNSVTIDYVFENLPGDAVFSVYGFDSDVGWVYHTNRAVIDEQSPRDPVSTFEVLPGPICGDVNHLYPTGDLDENCYVNWGDFGVFAAHWLESGCSALTFCGGADLDQNGEVNWTDFGIFAANWLECTDPNPPCEYNP